ncbi:MAG: hypothetical protein RLZZ444_2898 [Pseudomonadota bacterium]
MMPSRGASFAFRTLLILLMVGGQVTYATALTEPKRPPQTELQKDGQTPNDGMDYPDAAEDSAEDPATGLPMPDSLIDKNAKDNAGPAADDHSDIPVEIILDPALLPAPVQKLRVALVEAAASGDVERLRPLLGNAKEPTQIAIGDAPEDPILGIKSISGDPDGREILAIMLDILSTGAALVDKGTPNETYVWPYFAEKSLDKLSPPEIVELYRIVTAADVVDMKEFGGYNFYRIGISADGKWKFFVAGD